MSRRRRMLDEPTQSDATLLLKVEDLINIAMGPADENVVHFKVLQQVLFILARQMRILETKVEVRVGELQGLAQGAAQWRPRDNMLDGSESSEGLELGHKRSATSVTPSGKRDKRDKAHEAGYRAGAAGTGYQGAPGGYPGAPGGYPGGPAGGPPSAGYTGVPGGPPAAGYPGAPGGPSAAGYPGAPSGPPTAGQSGAPGGPPAAGHPGAPGGPPAAGYPGAPGGTTAAGYPGAPGAPGGPPAAGYPGAPGAPGGPPTALQPGVPGGPPTAGQPGAPGGPPTAGYPGAPGGPPSAEYPGAPGAPGGPPAAGYPGAPGGPSAAGYPGGPGAPGGPSAAGYPGGPGDPGGPPTAGYPGAPGGQPAGYPPGAGYPDGVAGAPGAGYPGGVAGAPGTGYPDGAAGAPGAGYPGGVAGAPGAGYPGGVAGAPGAGYPSGVAGAPGADYPGGVAGAPGAGYPGGVAGAPGAGYPGGVAGAPGAGYPGGVAGAPGAGYPGGVAGAPGAGYPDGVAGAPGAGYPGGVAGAPGAGYPGGVAGAPGAGYPGGLAGAPGVGYPSGALAPVGGPGTIAAYPGGAPGAVGRTGSITGMSQSPAGGRARIGSIEVVTAKEFALLESAVKALLEKASVPPLPKLPDNKQLRSDIVKGSASLTDTMQAMQLGARVQAAEKAIENMAEMLARLAASGSLPPEVAAQAAAIQGSVQAALQDARGGYGGGPGGPGGALTGGPGRGPGGPQGAWTGGPGGGPGGPEGAWAGGPGGGPGGPSGPGGPWTGGPGGGPGGPQGALTGGPGGGPGGPGGAWTGGPGGGPGGPGGAWTGGPGGGPGGPEGAWAGGPGGGPGGSRGAPGGGMEGKGGEGAKGVKGVPSQAAWTGGPGGGPGPGDQWVGGPGGAPGVGPGGQWVGGPEGGQGGVPGVRWGGGPGKAPGEFPGPAETTAQGPQKRPGGGQVSAKIPAHKLAPVTVADLDEAMSMLRDDIVKSMQQMTSRATNAADTASNNVKAIMDKLDTAIHLDTRLTFLQDMVNDYAEQLAGFDSGLSTQMTSFQDQMVTMRIDLQAGLAQLEQVNNNAETAAILELNERYEGLVTELDDTLHSHQGLTTFQRQLTEELKGLMETAEMMREQKADRDEVLDGLRDKADNSRLAGLLSEEDFEKAREELEMRIQMCYDKFRKQDAVWMKVINDFSEAIDSKAEITHLLGLREDVQDELQNLNLKVQQLAKLLGDPKAALLIRKLAKDGTCAVCRVPALMEPVEPTQPVALPRAVPFVRPEPTGAPAEEEEEICLRHFNLKEVMGPPSPREEPHMCQRWVGGSHTMMGAAKGMGHVGREIAPSMLAAPRPVKHFLGEGVDGKFYKLEEDYVPCVECNQFAPEKEPSGQKIPGEAEEAPIQDGSGDQGVTRSHVTVVDPATAARRITVVDDRDLRDAADASHRDSGGNAGPRKSALSTRRSSLGTRQSRVSGQELGDEMYPKMEVRISRMQRSAVILELDAKAHDVEIGQSVQGHVTIQDEKKAELETIKHQLEEASSKSDMHMKTEQVKAEEIEEAEKRTEEGAGRGDAPEPPPASALAEETPKE